MSSSSGPPVDDGLDLGRVQVEGGVGGRDRTVRVWSEDGTLEKTFKGHEADVYGAAFVRPGCVVSCSQDKTLRVWDFR